MQRAATCIFIAISALALIAVFSRRERFDPGVNLLEIDAGEPFARWNGFVVTVSEDGQLSIGGKHVESDFLTDEIIQTAKVRKDEFSHLEARLKEK